MQKIIESYFIVIIFFFSLCAFALPDVFISFKPLIPLMLGIILFGIGFTVEPREFKQIYTMRQTVVIATFVRSFFLATMAYLIGLLLHLPLISLAGLIIVGACPGGTAANVMSYLAKGNIALTVVLTFLTTLLSPIVMPALIYFFLHKHITIPYLGILKSIFWIVFLPLVGGMGFRIFFNKRLKILTQWLPIVSIGLIALAIACIMALVTPQLLIFPTKIITAVVLLNLSGYVGGFLLAKLMKYSDGETKSLCFEYSMFDVGIGIMIASLFFDPSAALPAALMAIIQNITASFVVRGLKQENMLLIKNG